MSYRVERLHPNLLTVGFMPVPPGHRQQVRGTVTQDEDAERKQVIPVDP